ncbi:MAG: potassium channel family protein, partial [Bacteroidota bacterium]|nr:potassium channel family protein [Bacteroidota bacterium]
LNTLFFIVVTVALVVHVARAREVDRSTLLSAINSYLLIGLSLSILFVILDLFVPGSFAQVDAPEAGFSTFLYYGFVTLTTLGYGDITPSTELARSLAVFTALFGQLYLVIIMALIIGKYLKGKKSTE